MLKLCMQNYKIYGVQEIDHGSYTVNGTTCVETQINGVVPRVSLSAMDTNDSSANLSTNKPKYLPAATKGRKRKLERSDDTKLHPPKKLNKAVKQTPPTKEIIRKTNSHKIQLNIAKTFNGDKLSGKRLRKPNSKFSDFIIPSNYNVVDEPDTDDLIYQPDDEFPIQEPELKVMTAPNEVKRKRGRPRLNRPRVKECILSRIEDEPKLDTNLIVDPLDIHHNDDVVHSFLPMVEPPQVLNYKDEDSEKEVSTSKTKDKKMNSALKLKDKVKQVSPTSSVVTQPITVLSPNWKDGNSKSQSLYGKVLCMPLVFTTNSQNTVIDVNDISDQKLMLLNAGDQRWVHIKPKVPGTTNKKVSPQKNNISNKTTQKGNNFKQTKTKVDLSASKESKPKTSKVLSTSRYILVDSDTKYKAPKVSDIDFNKLVRSLKAVKLPAKNWKIRIIVSPQETITEVIFTNKEQIERCVKFSRAVAGGYKVTFGKSEVKLLGAPTLQTFEDIAVLLEIIHTISPNSHVLEYC